MQLTITHGVFIVGAVYCHLPGSTIRCLLTAVHAVFLGFWKSSLQMGMVVVQPASVPPFWAVLLQACKGDKVRHESLRDVPHVPCCHYVHSFKCAHIYDIHHANKTLAVAINRLTQIGSVALLEASAAECWLHTRAMFPPPNARPLTTQIPPWQNRPLTQSAFVLHFLLSWHLAGQDPPQSMSVSSPS